MAARKSEDNSAPAPGSLVPGNHGGLIRYGSKRGNTPGTGRPKNEIRERMRKHLDEEVLASIMRDRKKGKLSSLDVGEFLARYGIGTQMEVMSKDAIEAEQRALVDTFSAALRAELSEEVAGRVVAKFRELWEAR